MDSRFQGLAGCYRAPERWELLASTARVRTGAVSFGGDLKAVGDALADYAAEMRPVAAGLSRLFDQALAFTVEVSGDGAWERDKSKVETNNSLIHQVSAQAEAKAAVERRCANRIEALVGGRVWHASDRPGDPAFAYGYADIPDDAATPWGAPADWEAPWEHGVLGAVTSYYKGVWIDGIGGAAVGLNTLTPNGIYTATVAALLDRGTWTQVGHAAQTTGQAWTELGKTAAGLLLYANPVGVSPLVWTSHRTGTTPAWVRACGRSALNTGKAMLAWDTWRTDPARAAGATSVNLATCFLPGGEAGAALKATRGIRAAEAGPLGRLLGHTDDAPVPHHLPDTATARAGDFGRSGGTDSRTYLPELDDPLASKVRELDTRTARERYDSPSHDGLPDELREPDKELGGGNKRNEPVNGLENREGPDSDPALPHDSEPDHRAAWHRVRETERPIVAHADQMYRSPAMDELRAAYAADQSTVVELAGRTVQYEPDLPASGMTFDDAFLLGPRAFSSESELAKTVLHENYRLVTTHKADGVDADLARTETEAAAEFAERTYKVLLEGF